MSELNLQISQDEISQKVNDIIRVLEQKHDLFMNLALLVVSNVKDKGKTSYVYNYEWPKKYWLDRMKYHFVDPMGTGQIYDEARLNLGVIKALDINNIKIFLLMVARSKSGPAIFIAIYNSIMALDNDTPDVKEKSLNLNDPLFSNGEYEFNI